MTHSLQRDSQIVLPVGAVVASQTSSLSPAELPIGSAVDRSTLLPLARQWLDVLALFPAGFDQNWVQAELGATNTFLSDLQHQGFLIFGDNPARRVYWIDAVRQRWLSALALQPADALVAQRHMATLMQQRMQQFELRLNSGPLDSVLPELDREWPNIVAAMDWIIESDEPRLGLSMIIPVARYCLLRGRTREGAEYIDAILGLSSLTTTYEFVQVMMLSGELQEAQNNLEDALDRYQTAFTLTTLPHFQQTELTALALLGLSRIHRRQNLREHALCYAQKAVELAQITHNEVIIARARRELRQIFGDGQD